MFCPRCGSSIPESCTFCTQCGTSLAEIKSNPAPQPVAQPQTPVYQASVYQAPVYQPPVAPQAPVVPPAPVAPQPVIPPKPVEPPKPVYIPDPVYTPESVYAAEPETPAKTRKPAKPVSIDLWDTVRRNLALILAGLSIFLLIFAFNNITGDAELNMVRAAKGESQEAPAAISVIHKFYDGADQFFWIARIGCVIYGVIAIVAAAAGILYFLQEKANSTLYKKIFSKFFKNLHPGIVVAVLVLIATVIQCLTFFTCIFDAGAFDMYVHLGETGKTMLIVYLVVAGISYLTVKQPEEE